MMGLHLVVLAKLNLTATAGHGASPLVVILVCPFLLKLSFSSRPFQRAYNDIIRASRLFFFQLGQIAFNNIEPAGPRQRWHRALRLVYQRLTHATRSLASESYEESLRALSMLAL
ncbi:unnamed protein product [Camellia sinensis]